MPHTARPTSTRAPAPVLISLPDGLSVSGVTLWAVRLAGVLASRGHLVTLVAHEEPQGQARVAIDVPSGVRILGLAGLPPLRNAAGDLSQFIPVYRDEVRRLSQAAGGPVVFLPTILGDSFGIAAAISLVEPELIRIAGFQHADTAYDTRLLTYYEPVLAYLVGVSRRVTESIAGALPHRGADIWHLPNAVDVADSLPQRELNRQRPLRLVYTGRIEHKQKRVRSLLLMSGELSRRGIAHTLTLVGDGPALAELRAEVGSKRELSDRVALLGAIGAAGVRAELRRADCFVLASRYEGLSVAMLEAMAEGCVPIVTDVASGAGEVVVDGLSGLLVKTDAGADDEGVGRALADAVARFASSDRSRFAHETWRRVRDSFSLESYAPRAAAIVNAAAESPARPWPAARAVAFTSSAAAGVGASGTVPPDAPKRLAAKLAELAGRRVILHGCGRHTIELAATLAASPARIVGVADDDPGRWGQSLLGWPIIAPASAGEHEASDVVISSWLHADDIYERRAVYENQGLRVHHLYRDVREATVDSYTSAACSN